MFLIAINSPAFFIFHRIDYFSNNILVHCGRVLFLYNLQSIPSTALQSFSSLYPSYIYL